MYYDCEGDLEICNFDKRTIGHLAASEKHYELLKFLALQTNFNFELRDRFGNSVIDSITDPTMKEEFMKIFITSSANMYRRQSTTGPID